MIHLLSNQKIFLSLLACWVTCALATDVQGQYFDAHEGSATAWQRHQGDCPVPAQHWTQQRKSIHGPGLKSESAKASSNETDSNLAAEVITFRNGPGTQIYISHNVPNSYLIDELKPSVRMRSDAAGVQILVRVVLPWTEAPDGNGAMTTTLAGDVYDQPGSWQTIGFDQESSRLPALMKEEMWYLRRKYGPQVTDRGAYIDRVVLNLYTAPGSHRVEIDNVRVDGSIAVQSPIGPYAQSGSSVAQAPTATPRSLPVEASPAANASPKVNHSVAISSVGTDGNGNGDENGNHNQISTTNSNPTVVTNQYIEPTSSNNRPDRSVALVSSTAPWVADRSRPSLVVRDGTVLLAEKRPIFPIIIEHAGEDFAFLNAIGFNTVELAQTATPEQLREATRLNMWIVCPPPASIGINDIGFDFDRVLAWSTGKQLTARDLINVQQRVREIRESDLRKQRPIVANVKSSWTAIGAQVDILSVGIEPLGTSFLASQYSDWLKQRAHSVATSKPLWADIQTELPEALLAQVAAIAQQVPPTPIEPQQLKFLITEAITGGARGLRFRSRNRLDEADPASRLRTLTIELGIAFANQIRPWAMGGALMGEIETDDPDVEITAINTNRSRLLLVQRPTHHEQYWAGDVPMKSITIRDTASPFTDRAYQLIDTRLKLLSSRRELGGTTIEIPDCPYTAAIVMTQAPSIVQQLNRTYQRPGKQSILQMRSELSQQWIAIMQLIDTQIARMGRGSAAVGGSINEAVTAFRVASEMMNQQSDDAAIQFLDRTEHQLGMSRRESAVGPLGLFQSKTSTPFVAHASLIPLHWHLTDRLKRSGAWNPNGLAAGDFESLEHMQRAGWENHRLDSPTLTTRVELNADVKVLGRKSLKLSVTPTAAATPMVEQTPLWIISPSVRAKPGQIVQIHGWVNVPQTIVGNFDGLRISDSVTGDALCERIIRTRGWEEFTLYRSVSDETDLHVQFELTGLGTAFLDEVTIRTIDLK